MGPRQIREILDPSKGDGKTLFTKNMICPVQIKRRHQMNLPKRFVESLKWAIYDWIGTISVLELSQNKNLACGIERLCRRLNALSA